MEVLRCTTNVHRFKINSESLDKTTIGLMQRRVLFRIVSKTNNIKNMTLTSMWDLKQIQFLFNLCPRLQQLNIDKLIDDIQPILHLLLSKDNNISRHLSSLCIE